MNEHIDVFVAVKEYCNSHEGIGHVCNFEVVAAAAKVDLSELEDYLSFFKKVGLIKYSMKNDKYLSLTSLGARNESLTKRRNQN